MSGDGTRRNRGGKANKNRKGAKPRGGKQKQSNPSGIDPKRPFWENAAGEAKVHEIIDFVRPAPDPTALVRSLGPPPLGKFADNAPHYYAAVYEKAQRFALAMATANGVLVMDDDAGAAGDDRSIAQE